MMNYFSWLQREVVFLDYLNLEHLEATMIFLFSGKGLKGSLFFSESKINTGGYKSIQYLLFSPPGLFQCLQ